MRLSLHRQGRLQLRLTREIPPDDLRIFIGSSSEELQVAQAIQLELDDVAECTIWNQSAFDLGATPIESLVEIGPSFTAAVLVLTPDDLTQKRGQVGPAPRDNLIFEAGFFTGTLGRARTFLVHPREPRMALPSDLARVTTATYASRSDGNLHAAVGPVPTNQPGAGARVMRASPSEPTRYGRRRLAAAGHRERCPSRPVGAYLHGRRSSIVEAGEEPQTSQVRRRMA